MRTTIMRTQGAALDREGTQALAQAVFCTGRRPASGIGSVSVVGWVTTPARPEPASITADSPTRKGHTARPAPGASPSWGGSRRRRGLDHDGLADSEGSPGPAPGCVPPGGPNQGRVGGARKAESETRSKREAQANANSSGISVASSVLKGHASGVGPWSLFRRFSRAALLRVSEWPLVGHHSLPPHTRAVSVRSVPTAGSRAVGQFPSPGHGPELSVLHLHTNEPKLKSK